MSEKRFIVFPNNVVWDNQLGEVVCRCILEGIGDAENVCQRLNEQQAIIEYLTIEKHQADKRFQTIIAELKKENEQLRMKLKGDDYIMVSEMLSNLRKTGICDGCKNKDKPVEWYLERGFSITGQICDRYEPEV